MGVLIGIVVGLIFAWMAIRVGLYVAWSAMFNLVISIYIAISLGPVVAGKMPLAGSLGASIVLIGLVAAVFAVLQGSCYLFITSQYEMSFPKLFDSISSGIIGFLAGMLLVSFLNIPADLIRYRDDYNKNSQSANSSYLNFWYDSMHWLVGKKDNVETEKLVAEIIRNSKKTKRTKAVAKIVENVKVAEANEPEVEIVIKDTSGDPPEFDFDKI